MLENHNEFEDILNEFEIDYDKLKIKKIKLLLEGLFIFSAIISFFTIFHSNNSDNNYTPLKPITEEPIKNYLFNNELKVSDLKNIRRVKRVTVKRGDNMYNLFLDHSLDYSSKNIENVKLLNNIQDLTSIQIGDKLFLPTPIEDE